MSVRARLSGRVDGALFMSKYERLNQVVRDPPKSRHKRNFDRNFNRQERWHGNNDNNNNANSSGIGIGNDLFLDELQDDDNGGNNNNNNTNDGGSNSSSYREHIPSPTNNVVMDATRLANPQRVRSSMFFEQDGRMLMRLPRDQVRLVMDYNLEPGILSVEQWRSREEAEATTAMQTNQQQHHINNNNNNNNNNNRTSRHNNYQQTIAMQRQQERERENRRRQRRREKEKERRQRRREKEKERRQRRRQRRKQKKANNKDKVDPEDPNHNDDDSDASSESESCSSSSSSDDDDTYLEYDIDVDADIEEQQHHHEHYDLPELKYVITVPDDLYRRMVKEMSAKAFPPYWGFFKCCNQESEQADIKLALVILTFVMLLLFVGSLEWRTT